MMRELQKHHRPLRFIAQCSRAGHNLRKEALSVFYVYLLAFRSQRRDALNWDRRGQAYCCVEVAQEIEKNPVGISTSPSQLAVKTGRSGGGLGEGYRADSLCPISCLKLDCQLMRQGLGVEAVGSCKPEMTEKLKCKMKSSKAFGFILTQAINKLPTNSGAVERSTSKGQIFFFLLNKTLTFYSTDFIFLCNDIIIISHISCKHFYLKIRSPIIKANLYFLYFKNYFWSITGSCFLLQTHQIYIGWTSMFCLL